MVKISVTNMFTGLANVWVRLEATLKHLLSIGKDTCIAAFNNPLQFVQVITALLLLALSYEVSSEWMKTHTRSFVEVPLLLIGVFVILLIILRTTNAFAISMSVLIVGTVVAGDRFMLAVTALLKGGQSPESTMKFVTDIYGSASRSPIDPKALASTVSSVSREAANSDEATQAVTKVLLEAQARQLLSQLHTTIPLRRLIEGGDQWRRFVAEYQGVDYFRGHMAQMRVLGLVSYAGDNFAEAKLTALGEQLKPYALTSSVFRDEPRVRLLDGPMPSKLSEVNAVAVGTTTKVTFSLYNRYFLKFHVNIAGKYQIETSQPQGADPVDTLIVLRNSSFDQIAEDDDSGTRLYSKSSRQLSVGDYVLEIRTLDDAEGVCNLLVSKLEK